MNLLLIVITLYLISSGFLTIIERKIISLIQARLSNYRFSVFGIFQFFMDFLKLINKSLLKYFNYKIFKSLFNIVFFLFTSSFLFYFLTYTNTLKHMLFNFFTIILTIFMSTVVKIFCVYFLSFQFSKGFVDRLKLIIILIDSVTGFIDYLLYVVIISSSSINLSLSNRFLYNSFKLICLFLFFTLVLKTFRSPFDYIERESECLNSVFLSVEGVEYSVWTLLEYTQVISGILYVLTISGAIFSPNRCQLIIVFLTFSFLICVFRATYIRFRFDLLLMFLLLIFLFLLFIFYIFVF